MTDQPLGSDNFNITYGNNDGSDNAPSVQRKDKDIDRVVTSNSVKNKAKKQGAQMWPVDPATLKGYAKNDIASIYIDTLAKDSSVADWTVSDDEDIRDQLLDIFPDKTFTDGLEATSRDLIRCGNAFWVKHRYQNSDEVAEVVIVDPATMYIKTDDNGFIDSYVHITGSGRQPTIIDSDDVIHFEWQSSSDRYYSASPVEDIMGIIELADEIQLKEILDLTEGGQSGVLTQTESHDTNPMSSKDYDQFKSEWNANEGERHKTAVVTGKWDFVETSTSYEDMDLVERYDERIQHMGAAFKVNPTYAGFSISSDAGGIGQGAKDESQRESYKQRGLRVILNQLEERINLDLIPEFSDDVRFEFETETESKNDRVNYYNKLAETAGMLSDAGVNFRIEDDKLVVDDTVINPAASGADEQIESIVEESKEDDDVQKSSRVLEVEELYDKDISEVIKEFEADYDSRSAAIDELQDELEGTLSRSTYYNWIEKYA